MRSFCRVALLIHCYSTVMVVVSMRRIRSSTSYGCADTTATVGSTSDRYRLVRSRRENDEASARPMLHASLPWNSAELAQGRIANYREVVLQMRGPTPFSRHHVKAGDAQLVTHRRIARQPCDRGEQFLIAAIEHAGAAVFDHFAQWSMIARDNRRLVREGLDHHGGENLVHQRRHD